MGFQTIDNITVEGIDYDIYSFDYTPSISEGRSEINIEYINENGNYLEPELSAFGPVTIKLGELYTFNYFPISFREKRATNGGKTLSVTYVDGSFVLDKVNVGLLNKHGSESVPPHLMIVGREKDPCEEVVTDPCDPCDTSLNCVEARRFNVLDVVYNFNDLLDAIEEYPEPSIVIGNRPSLDTFNDKYEARYTGTLRSVLQSWCADYGFTFYWEDNQLWLIDLKSGFNINTTKIEENCTLETIREKTLEGTIGQGVIGHYAQNSQESTNSCSGSTFKRIILRPVTLDSIFGNSYGFYRNNDTLEAAASLIRYSKSLRDAFMWFEHYGIANPFDANQFVGKELKLLGDFKINGVIERGDFLFDFLVEALRGYNVNDDSEIDLDSSNFYFVFGTQNTELLEDFQTYELKLAEEFLGRFFIRFGRYIRKGENAQIEAPDGNVQFVQKGEGISLLPFAKFAYDTAGQTFNSRIFDRFKLTQTEDDELVENGPFDDTAISINSHSMIVLDREAAWYPDQTAIQSAGQNIEEAAAKRFLRRIDLNLIDAEQATNFTAQVLTNESIRTLYDNANTLYVINMDPPNFSSTTDVNPHDAQSTNVTYESTSYGLRSAACRKFSVNNAFDIYMPSLASVTDPESSYIVVIKNTGSDINVRFPKFEHFEQLIHTDPINTLGYNINFRELNNDITAYLETNCSLSSSSRDRLITAIQEFIDKLQFEVDQPFERLIYKLSGLPEKEYKIEDGLERMSIRVGSNGIQTELSFGNSKKRPISLNVITREFELLFKQFGLRYNFKQPANQQNP